MARAAAAPEAGALWAGSGQVLRRCVGLQARLSGLPELTVDDPEVLDGDLNVGVGGVLPAHQSPRDRVLEVLAPVPDQPAIIGGVPQDAVATALAAADGVLEPDPTVGSGTKPVVSPLRMFEIPAPEVAAVIEELDVETGLSDQVSGEVHSE
jgi:hypothetical protein